MKKIAVMAIAFLLFIPFASINGNNVSLTNSTNGNILYVGGSGENNYTTIQNAINYAEDGFTIYVYPRNYNESIVINRSISLIGIEQNGEKPVIHGNENNITVLIEADNCTIRNFIIMEGFVGLETRNASFITIENNVIEGAGVGMEVYSSNTLIRNNTVTKSKGIGIYVDPIAFTISLTGNFISQNGWSGTELHGDNHIISYNNVTGNLHGIELYFASDCIISFNHVYFNQQYGICVDTSTNVSILNNTIHNHAYGGLQLMDCSNCTVSGNEIYYNDRGIMVESNYMWEKQYNLIKRNNVYSNSGVGIYIEGSLRNDFTENNLMDNGDNAWFWEQTIIGYPYSPLRPCYNVWDKNYWSDWSLPTPKPIKGVLTVWWSSLYIDFHWFMFDKHPAMEPYGNFTLENTVQPMNTLEKGGLVSASSVRNFCVKS